MGLTSLLPAPQSVGALGLVAPPGPDPENLLEVQNLPNQELFNMHTAV